MAPKMRCSTFSNKLQVKAATAMNIIEKIYAVFSILFAAGLLTALVEVPQLRQPQLLLPLAGAGLLVNVGLMFVVFRDIFLRTFPQDWHRFVWIALLLFIWPAILVYLPLHGFRSRPQATAVANGTPAANS